MTSQTCCFCCSITTGVITLGVLSLLGGMTDIFFGSEIINISLDCNESNSNSSAVCNEFGEGLTGYGATIVVRGCIGILVSILMLIGVHTRKPNLLMPYVAMMVVYVIASVAVGIMFLLLFDDYQYYGIWFLCWSSISCYFIKVVRLYRVSMIQQVLADNGLITTDPSGDILTPGYMTNSKPSVGTVYTTQPGYATQTTYSTQQAYPAPGSYPQPGYPQQGYPQDSYPPPYPGNQPSKM